MQQPQLYQEDIEMLKAQARGSENDEPAMIAAAPITPRSTGFFPAGAPLWALPFWSAACVAAGFASGQLGGGPDAWYRSLIQPPILPPDWVFPVVWTTLYILMGASAWSVYYTPVDASQPSTVANRRSALAMFVIQLGLNLAWNPMFFGLHSVALGALFIVPNLFAVVLTVRAFARVNAVASEVLYPYLAWSSFATVLAWWLWYLNPETVTFKIGFPFGQN
eukprot:TRINITY_DN673_c0_g1_i1.p1 TRINITY_DN673_c0_g1~~TRINITY_DN673_c0_g1_i1.p1  ORF type:complete len:234 (+),score=31.68 TRINITY_DN673_c0_g1_i1:42-704(+)